MVAEAMLGMVILGITAGLVSVAPAATAPAVPAVVTVVQGDLSASLTVTPARVGANDIHLTVTLPADAVEPTVGATVRISLAERGIAPESIAMVGEGPDHYSAFGVQIPFAGTWQVDILVSTSTTETVLLQGSLEIVGH